MTDFFDVALDPDSPADIASSPDEALIVLAATGNALADAELRRRGI